MATPPSTGGRRPDSKLPKGLEPLPSDVPKEVWMLWPRKGEAHLIWGLSERRVTGKCTAQMLCQYMCPDQSIRLDPDEMRAVFGEPGEEQEKQRLGTAGKPGKAANGVDVDVDDPLPAVLREVLGMLRDAREDSRKILALVIDPANQLTSNLLTINDRQAQRIGELEQRFQAELEASAQRNVEQHLLDIELRREGAREQRRASLMQLLQAQVPALVSKWTGATLLDFIDGVDPIAVQALLASEMLPREKAAQLQALFDQLQAVRATKAKATEPQSSANGAAAPQPTGAK
jgi:hypothetical protein